MGLRVGDTTQEQRGPSLFSFPRFLALLRNEQVDGMGGEGWEAKL